MCHFCDSFQQEIAAQTTLAIPEVFYIWYGLRTLPKSSLTTAIAISMSLKQIMECIVSHGHYFGNTIPLIFCQQWTSKGALWNSSLHLFIWMLLSQYQSFRPLTFYTIEFCLIMSQDVVILIKSKNVGFKNHVVHVSQVIYPDCQAI